MGNFEAISLSLIVGQAWSSLMLITKLSKRRQFRKPMTFSLLARNQVLRIPSRRRGPRFRHWKVSLRILKSNTQPYILLGSGMIMLSVMIHMVPFKIFRASTARFMGSLA